MKIHKIPLTPAARTALEQAETVGDRVSLGKPGSLPAKTYQEVVKVLDGLGYKWNRREKAHIKPGSSAHADLAILLQEGHVVNEQKTLEFYPTVPAVAETMAYRMLAGLIQSRDSALRILEPSAGAGALILACQKVARLGAQKLEFTAVEIDPKRYGALTALTTNPHMIDFLLWKPNFQFDGVIMNPPFHGQADLRHILHAWDMLKPHGMLATLAWPGWADSKTQLAQKFRQIMKQEQGRGWVERLDPGEADGGVTKNALDLIVLRKPPTASQQAREQDLRGTLRRKVPKQDPQTPEERSAQTGQGAAQEIVLGLITPLREQLDALPMPSIRVPKKRINALVDHHLAINRLLVHQVITEREARTARTRLLQQIHSAWKLDGRKISVA